MKTDTTFAMKDANRTPAFKFRVTGPVAEASCFCVSATTANGQQKKKDKPASPSAKKSNYEKAA